jgi:hypothetical protein
VRTAFCTEVEVIATVNGTHRRTGAREDGHGIDDHQP